MKPISILSTFAIILSSFVLISCTKESISLAELQFGKWEVEKIKKAEDSSFRKAEKSYFLDFDEDNGYAARLDVNRCSGTYELINSKNIKFDGMFCTYNCCDTEYAEDFARLVRVMTKYSKRGNKLILEGEGQIVLKRVE